MVKKDYSNKLSKILSYIRISKDISQEEIAKILGCSRPRIQRLEFGETLMNCVEWEVFKDFFGVSLQDIQRGFLYTQEKEDSIKFKIPKPLTKSAFSKGQVLYIHSWNFKNFFGEEKFEEFCKKEKVNPLYFTNLQNCLNMDFNLRLIQEMMMQGKMKKEQEFDQFTKSIHALEGHHHTNLGYLKTQKGIERILFLLQNMELYEQNHLIKVEEVCPSKKSITISVAQRDHVNLSLYFDPFIHDFFEKFFKFYFKNLLEEGAEAISLQKMSPHSKGIYKITDLTAV